MYHLVFLMLLSQLFTEASTDIELYPLITPPEVIMKHGYPAEIHHVVTEDGYILPIFRIPYSPKYPAAPNKTVALFHPGLSSTSRDWVLLGPEKSIGFLLADEGYDVWLANYRGGLYGRNHTSLSVKSKQFWNFSVHEMGVYDVPAMVDYIINKTGQERHYHVGISMGTTVFCVFASARPEYNKNIRLFVAEGPTIFFKGADSVVYSLFIKKVVDMLGALGVNELFPSPIMNKLIAKHVCGNNLTVAICADFLFLFSGFDPKQLNLTLLPILVTHVGVGVSLKTIRHYFQMVDAEKFQLYDYGKLNMQKYGQQKPPEYDLKSVTAPVFLMYASRDPNYNETDVFNLCKAVSNCVETYRVPHASFTHFGFVYANDVKTLVNDVLIEQFKKY